MHNPRISFAVNYDTWWEGTARIVDQKKEPKLVAEVSNLAPLPTVPWNLNT